MSATAARQKYLQLGRELEKMPTTVPRRRWFQRAKDHSLATAKANMLHTHSKLGIFLEEALGSDAWRGSARIPKEAQ